PGACAMSASSLWSTTPVPAAMTPAPKPVLMVVVSATALPSPSTTDTFAVPASRPSAVSGAGHGCALISARRRARRAGASREATGTGVNSGSPYQWARAANARALTPASRRSPGGGVAFSAAGASGGGRAGAERLEHDAAGARWREGDQGATAVAADQRLAPAHAVVGQIACRQHAAARLDGGDDRRSDRSGIEGAGAVRGDRLQRARQVGLDDAEAGTRHLTVRLQEHPT